METHMPYGITRCYLPSGRGDIPAFTTTKLSWVYMYMYVRVECTLVSPAGSSPELHCVSEKNDTDLARYNSDVRQPILRNFDKTVAERVDYQNDLFLTSPNWCLCTTWGNINPRNCVFSLTRCIVLYQQTRKHVQIISWLHLNPDSLLIRYRSNSAKCYLLSNTP